MAYYNGMCKSFFLDMMTGEHDLETDTLMLALYEDRNALSADTTEYSPVGECIGTNYMPGGIEIFVKAGYPLAEPEFVAACRFEDLVFTNISASIGAALIYNDENKRAIRVIDFGDNQLVVTSDFNIKFPDDLDPPVYIKLIKR